MTGQQWCHGQVTDQILFGDMRDGTRGRMASAPLGKAWRFKMGRSSAALLSVLAALLLLAVGFVTFTGYVAYAARRPIIEAYDGPPLGFPPPDPAHLGALFDAALAWAVHVCGAVLAVVAAGLAVRHAVARDPAEDLLGPLAVLLAGSVLVTQHWGAAVAVAVLGIASGTELPIPDVNSGRGTVSNWDAKCG